MLVRIQPETLTTTKDMTQNNQDIWQLFDRRVLLTVKKRRDRLVRAKQQLQSVGLTADVFYAVDAIGPHQSFTLSQKQILTDFIKSDNKLLLTMEDDIEFRDLQPLREAIYDINLHQTKWDVLYLGGNLLQGRVIEKRRHICKVTNVLTTHAVVYTRYAASILLQHFPNENEVMFDTYLGAMQGALKTYMINPMVAIQRPDYSDIWGHNVNYISIFDRSNLMMK